MPVTTGGEAKDNHVTLENTTASEMLTGGNAARSASKNKVTIHGSEVRGEISGGRTANAGSAIDNTVTIHDGKMKKAVYGGYAMDTGSTNKNHVNIHGGEVEQAIYGGRTEAAGSANDNEVTITGGTLKKIHGGTAQGNGSANGNTVTVTGGTVNGDIVGGDANAKDASDNTVFLGAITVDGGVFGGRSHGAGKTNDNTIHLQGTQVNGTVTGGNAANATGNTLVVHSHAGGSSIGDFSGIQNLHFYLENGADHAVTPMLKLRNVTAKDISKVGIGLGVGGGAKVMNVGESIRLLQTKSGGAGLTTADEISNQITGEHGASIRYKFDIKKADGDPTALIATVTAKEMKEQTKSFVETRAALTDLVNYGGDVLAGASLSSAKQAAASAKSGADMERYQVWAGMGGSSLRAESGSHVDTHAWHFNLGWARQDAKKAGQVLFSPFVEYGRGSYDSYVDDGTETVHGNGTTTYLGLGLLARMDTTQGLWYEGSLRGGRTTSDYQSSFGGMDVTYDGSNTYYAAHLGIGKDIRVKNGNTITPYLRYFYAHQNGMTATLSSGDVYDFGSVNSHRLRLGFQYTHEVSEGNEFYAGFAWEYEMNGEATATYQANSAPSPSLKGSSGMLELGYRFTPMGQPLSYDLRFTGWQGVRRGFTGGANVTWAF